MLNAHILTSRLLAVNKGKCWDLKLIYKWNHLPKKEMYWTNKYSNIPPLKMRILFRWKTPEYNTLMIN